MTPSPLTTRPTPLVDGFGRVVKDLRLSITDRCNFRCTYCMPEEGLKWLPRDEVLTFEELTRVAQVCVERWGFDAIRITGGEPLVRAGVERLVAMLAPLGVDLALTTNGLKLAGAAQALADAGLTRVNVSLDSLCAHTFAELTRRDELAGVLEGIDAALAAGLTPVKVNTVVMRGVNDDEIVDLAAFGRDRGVEVRFIEFMPLDAQGEWNIDRVVPAREIIERIDAVFPLEPVDGRSASDHQEPAARWRYRDGAGFVGAIPSVTEPFCDRCDRVRVTADGRFRSCLFSLDEHDLRTILRSAAPPAHQDDEIAAAIEAAVGAKWAGHRIGKIDFIRPSRSMSQIGG
ncbi:MAG TPA: GTP 3',8-cyclase MoaA [Acidimicrobiia bacterium]|nr:GTP 3',8-cyclase MoaA [Acidimicrobiia bacterium]